VVDCFLGDVLVVRSIRVSTRPSGYSVVISFMPLTILMVMCAFVELGDFDVRGDAGGV
jgi:hypothetical protein